MKDYQVLGASNLESLEAVVNAALEDGFVLVGGVAVSVRPWDDGEDFYAYIQAVARPQ